MKHVVASLWLVILSCSPAWAGEEAYRVFYGELLSHYVKDGQKQNIQSALVDYENWGNSPRHAQAMAALQQTDPNALAGRERMAYWINVYNLLTIDLIVTTGEQESIKNQGGVLSNVWKSHRWNIRGKDYTLDGIEHKILRPMGDPRVHMAINCASLSCPDLRAEPYDAATLDAQLDAQVQRFLMNPTKGMRMTEDGLKLSPIFTWFADDFGDDPGVIAFIVQHVPAAVGKPIAGHFDYNWNLNSR